MRFLPRALGIDLPAEARKIAQERGIGIRKRTVGSAATLPIVRAYRVSDEMANKTIEQARIELDRKVLPLRVRRGREILDAEPSLELQSGDVISVIASVEEHRGTREGVGEEILDPELIVSTTPVASSASRVPSSSSPRRPRSRSTSGSGRA